jgi:hypothetical protein
MNQERDKFLTEQMGECWHDGEPFFTNNVIYCPKCHKNLKAINEENDFSTWEGFGKLWEWAQKQNMEWQCRFNDYCFKLLGYRGGCSYEYIPKLIINPDRFADTVYAYLKENV